MDTLVIWFASRFLHFKVKTVRVALSAGLGALVSIILVVLNTGNVVSTLFSVLSASLMTLITFGRSTALTFFKRLAVLWTVGLLLGGVMTYILSIGNSRIYYPQYSHTGAVPSPIGLLPMGALICAVLVALLSYGRVKKEVSLRISLGGKSVRLQGIVDSGNLLRDVITGEPVIVASEEAVSVLFNDEEIKALKCGKFSPKTKHLERRYRFVTADTVAGKSVIPCVRADEIIVGEKKCRALIGMCDSEISEARGLCIVPDILVY